MGPPVAVYVVATVVGVAAVVAFKEFVYEPHIAPKLEAWAENFLQRRRAARNRRPSAVPVRSSRRRGSSSSSRSSHPSNGVQRDRGAHDAAHGPNDLLVDGLELEALVSREVDEWRNEVLRSQEETKGGLRRRRKDRLRDDFDGFETTSTTLDESFTSLTHTPLAPTHVISNISSPITPSTMSLPHTPTPRHRSESQSMTTPGDASSVFIVTHSPSSSTHEIAVMTPIASQDTAGPMIRPTTEDVDYLDIASPSPLVIPNVVRRLPTNEDDIHPLSFTPTHQSVADDSPFGPLLPDTPRSSAEIYGERPFSPIVRVMGSSSGSGSGSGSRRTLSSRANSASSLRTLGSSGVPRKSSGLVNEVITSGSDDDSDEENRPHTSTSTFDSVISSLSERYPAPPTPPVIISSPTSSVGIISAPSSPRSGVSEVVVRDALATASQHYPHILPQTHSSPPLLQVTTDPSSPHMTSRSRSQGNSSASPALSYVSFLSPMPISAAVSESEGDEFLSVASDDSDWNASPVSPSARMVPVQDRATNPFLDFEHLTHDPRGNDSEHGDGSEGSEVLVSEPGHEGESEVGSDESWRSARRH